MTDSHSTATHATILGAGPAGVSTRLWMRTFELPCRWLSADGTIGGLLDRVANPIENYPGLNVEDGSDLKANLREQADQLDLAPEAVEIEELEWHVDEKYWRLTPSDGEPFDSRTVVLATGTEYRQLGVPGEAEGLGDYVSQSTARDADKFGGETVAIVGGGDAGFEGALQLAERGSQVHMLLRNGDFKARPLFVERVDAHPDIFLHPFPTIVQRIDPLDAPRGCRLHLETQGEPRTLEVACLFVRIGVDPVVPDLTPAPEVDEEGHVVVDKRQKTTAPRLYAAGEVTATPPPSIAVSVGGGARAAHAAAAALGWTR